MAAHFSGVFNGNLVTAYTAIFHPLKCAQYSRKTSFDSIMTNWGEKCSWYLEKSGTEEVFILKLHYKPTSVTVMWLSSFILWIVKTSTCSSWLSGYTTLQGICAKSLCFHSNRNESMITPCLACSLLSSSFACAATPGSPPQQYEHTSWISGVEVWNWDNVSFAGKILSIRCNNEVVCIRTQLCHVLCVFFIVLHILIWVTEGEMFSGKDYGGTDVMCVHPIVSNIVWKWLTVTRKELRNFSLLNFFFFFSFFFFPENVPEFI